MANYLKGIGDTAMRANEILPSLDARINNFLCGHTAGVINDEFNEFSASTIDRGVVIRSGLMQAHGYFGASDTETQINFIMPSTTNYVQIYAEIDLSVVPNRFEIKATSQSNSSAYTFRQDNLRSITNGKYQFSLWQVTLTASTIILTDRRVTIQKPLNAVNAETAANALALAGASTARSSGVFTFTSGNTALGKLVCIPANAKLEYKIPLLSGSPRYFEKDRVWVNIPNWDSTKTYEWVFVLNGNNPSGEVQRVRGGEFVLRMCASGWPINLFMYGHGTFVDGAAWDDGGYDADFNGEEMILYQIYEIREVS